MNFDRMWRAYPTEYYPCIDSHGTPHFDHQCAIRFGIAPLDGGVDLRSFAGDRCWFNHRNRHLLRGEEIAAWMVSKPDLFGRVIIRQEVDETNFHGLRGIMFCRNFWGQGNQGDHIDLWNRNYMKTGNPTYIARSTEVWFWTTDRTMLHDLAKPTTKKELQRAGTRKLRQTGS